LGIEKDSGVAAEMDDRCGPLRIEVRIPAKVTAHSGAK
jgi:hypothetical protein